MGKLRHIQALFVFLVGCAGFSPGTNPEEFFWPVTGIIFQGFYGDKISGESPGTYFDENNQEKVFSGPGRMHRAIDIDIFSGTDIGASRPGVARRYDWDGKHSYGNHVVVDHGGGYWTLYAHLSRISIADGQTVKAGDKLGDVGSTGNSTGPHLHFEIRHSNNPDVIVAAHYIPGKRAETVFKGSPIPFVYPQTK